MATRRKGDLEWPGPELPAGAHGAGPEPSRAAEVAPAAERAYEQKLEALREALTPSEQTLLMLRVEQGLDWPEIARQLSDGGPPLDPATLRARFAELKEKVDALARALGLEP